MQRDVRDLASIDQRASLSRLLVSVAARLTGLLNYADLARDCGLPQSTLKRYLALLRATHLVQLVPAWTPSISQRVVKSPKVLISDTGLAAHLLGASTLRRGQRELGALVEAFVVLEIQRQASWYGQPIQLHHYRTHAGQEVDLVLERGGRTLIGVEVKLSTQVPSSDARSLQQLRDLVPERFCRGIVLYAGEQTLTVAGRIQAVPLAALWQ